MRTIYTIAVAALAVVAGCWCANDARAAGDFPLASCSGWGGTVTDIVGVDTGKARMEGSITKADLREYCGRDPGGETTQNGGSVTVDQCVEKHWKEERGTKLAASADCKRGTLTMTSTGQKARKAHFPLRADADTSCASGMPPLVEQFKMLCPTAANRMGVE